MPSTKSVEKMQIVIDSLYSNPDLVVVGGFEEINLQTGERPSPHEEWSHLLDIYTHPKMPIYDAEDLNDLMFGLVPNLKPDNSRSFAEYKLGLDLGYTYYDEIIGKVALGATVAIDEDNSLVRSGFLGAKWHDSNTRDLRRRTLVRLFPDQGHLLDAAEGRNKMWIPRSDLGGCLVKRAAANLLESPTLNHALES